MSEETEAVQVIAREIKRAITEEMQNASFDKTVRARVVEKISDNKYKIIINNAEYTASSNSELIINDTVYATIIQNNYSNIYIHSSSQGSGNASSPYDIETELIDVGQNGTVCSGESYNLETELIDVGEAGVISGGISYGFEDQVIDVGVSGIASGTTSYNFEEELISI